MKSAFGDTPMNPRWMTFNLPSNLNNVDLVNRARLLDLETTGQLSHSYICSLFDHQTLLVQGIDPVIAYWYLKRYELMHSRPWFKGDYYGINRNEVSNLWLEDMYQIFLKQPDRWRILEYNQQKLLAMCLRMYSKMI